MSIQQITRVLEHSKHRGSRLLVMLAIAWHDARDESGAWPSQGRIARLARLSTRQVRRLIAQLVESGELEVDQRPGRTDLLRIRIDGDSLAGLGSQRTIERAAELRRERRLRDGSREAPLLSDRCASPCGHLRPEHVIGVGRCTNRQQAPCTCPRFVPSPMSGVSTRNVRPPRT